VYAAPVMRTHQLGRQSAFACQASRLQQDELAFASLCLDQRDQPANSSRFFFPSDEVGHTSRMERLEAASTTVRRSAAQVAGPAIPLESFGSEALKLKQVNQGGSVLPSAINHSIGLSYALQTRRKVRKLLAHDAPVPAKAGPD